MGNSHGPNPITYDIRPMANFETYPRIALLQCDHVPPHLRHLGGNYPEMFQNAFPTFEFDVFDVTNGGLPASSISYETYMVTGSRYSVYDDLPWIADLKELIRSIYQRERKFIGICFGHQLLADALGGHVKKSSSGWCVGYHTLEILQQMDWMQPPVKEFKVLMSCQDQVTSLPPGGQVLATGGHCEFGMFTVGDRTIGIQGHPEFTPAYMHALILERMNRIGADKAQNALSTLQYVPEINLFEVWMRNFVASR